MGVVPEETDRPSDERGGKRRVVARVDALQLPSYSAIVMPRLTPRHRDGDIIDIDISYPCDLETQMLEYSAFARSADALATPAASR